jgi:hypothetical protein
VRFAEPLTDAAQRVAREELRTRVSADGLVGYIESQPLRARARLPVGIAFRAVPPVESPTRRWFKRLRHEMHDEQRAFLLARRLAQYRGWLNVAAFKPSSAAGASARDVSRNG